MVEKEIEIGDNLSLTIALVVVCLLIGFLIRSCHSLYREGRYPILSEKIEKVDNNENISR